MDLSDGVMSSGFARLTQYHWASLLKEADDLIKSGACAEVSINFICHDEYFERYNDRGELIRESDLDNGTYSQRISQAQFDHVFIDKGLLNDSNGNSAVFENTTCFKDNSSHIERVPRACGESHTLNAQVLQTYKSGLAVLF